MDVQLQELIDKIKKDGVASAENASAAIIAEAEKKAAQIVADAEAKAENILKSAKTETERMEKSSKDAIAQAGRNLLISFERALSSFTFIFLTSSGLFILSNNLLNLCSSFP